MRSLMTQDPMANGGLVIESDLYKMADDGCTLAPTQLSDRVEQDNLPPDPPPLPKSHWQQQRDRIEMRGRWQTACERMVLGMKSKN
jgi:hypothetical protein